MPHPALALAMARRMEYLTVVASMVTADGREDPAEVASLRELCAALELTARETDAVVKSAASCERKAAEALAAGFEGHELRFSLLLDAVLIAFADGRLAAGEGEAIKGYAARVKVPLEQASLIGRYVEDVLHQRGDRTLAAQLEKLLGASAQGYTLEEVLEVFARVRSR